MQKSHYSVSHITYTHLSMQKKLCRNPISTCYLWVARFAPVLFGGPNSLCWKVDTRQRSIGTPYLVFTMSYICLALTNLLFFLRDPSCTMLIIHVFYFYSSLCCPPRCYLSYCMCAACVSLHRSFQGFLLEFV